MYTHSISRPFAAATLALGLLFSLAVTAVAQQPATVRIWNYNIHDKKYQQKMYKLFNQRNPDIKIDYTSIVVNTYGQVLEAAEVAKQLPELFVYEPNSKLNIDYLRTHKLVLPLNDLAPSDAELKAWMAKFPLNLGKFVEGVTTFGGKPYFVDLGGSTNSAGILPLFYNKSFSPRRAFRSLPRLSASFARLLPKRPAREWGNISASRGEAPIQIPGPWTSMGWRLLPARELHLLRGLASTRRTADFTGTARSSLMHSMSG